ncbi:hypothetical protein TYRP_001625 [Tyrophagus putrescentiae]|nr:hypothetical protein TYRP_001625 [Tyrophagus putrescentiae]
MKQQQQQQQQMNEPLMRPGEENWRGEGFMTADDAANAHHSAARKHSNKLSSNDIVALTLDIHGLDEKVDAYGGALASGVLSGGELTDETGLADAGIAHKDNLEQQIRVFSSRFGKIGNGLIEEADAVVEDQRSSGANSATTVLQQVEASI